MNGTYFLKLRSSKGFTVLEILIAALITGILATASFRFYTSMHQQTETQMEVSDVQHLCRSSVHEIKKTLRLAGFKLLGHPAYVINGDSLSIFYSDTQPVDTITYYLEEFNSYEYSLIADLPEGVELFNLMKKQNSAPAEVCADYITHIGFDTVNARTMQITIEAQVTKRDETYNENEGFRTWSLDEQVTLRNISL
jgi:prepilin-type N-terminal cleavage/methylation domain-containing protein